MTVATSLVAEQTHVNLESSSLHPGQTKAMLGQGLSKGFSRHSRFSGIQVFIQWLRALLHHQIFFHISWKLCSEKIIV
jgi:hypothetical protein